MLYTYILEESIKSPTLILTADHLTLLFLPGIFYQIKNFLFLLWVNLYMIMGLSLHDPPPFNCPFFMTPPFSESQNVVTLPPPPLISDMSLISSTLQKLQQNRPARVQLWLYSTSELFQNLKRRS